MSFYTRASSCSLSREEKNPIPETKPQPRKEKEKTAMIKLRNKHHNNREISKPPYFFFPPLHFILARALIKQTILVFSTNALVFNFTIVYIKTKLFLSTICPPLLSQTANGAADKFLMLLLLAMFFRTEIRLFITFSRIHYNIVILVLLL